MGTEKTIIGENYNIGQETNKDTIIENFEFKTENNIEIYTIDLDIENKHIIFGGQNDCAEVYNYEDDFIVTKVEDFGDSVIYTKFLDKNRFIIVAMDGTIALMEHDKEICIINIGEDISSAIFNEKLVIGTTNGKVHLYDRELEHINTFGGHYSEILSLDYCQGRIISMCNNFLVVNDEYGRELYLLKATEATAFKYIDSDVICFARENKIQIFKKNKKLFEHTLDAKVECIEYLNKTLVIGGDFEHILLLDTTGRYATFKLETGATISNIKKYDEYRVAFSTNSDILGIIDIRDVNTLTYFEPNIGSIFEFAVSKQDIAVAGELGYNVINLETTPGITKNDL